MGKKRTLKATLIILAALCLAVWSVVLLSIFVFSTGGDDAESLASDSAGPGVNRVVTPDTTPDADPSSSPMPSPQQETSPPSTSAPATPTPAPVPTPVPPPETVSINRNDAELTEMLDGIAAKYKCAAVSVAVFDGINTFYTYQYGWADIAAEQPVDADTKFRVASLSKPVTTICALHLAEQGLLDLDADISDYLGYKVRNPGFPDTPITARMLMQHTSSIYDSDAFLQSRRGLSETRTSTRDLLDSGTSYAQRRPGSRSQYTNFGMSVLAAVCEMVSGKLLDTLARDTVFSPLGIDAAYTPGNLRDTYNLAVIYNANHRVGYSREAQLLVTSSGELGRDHHLGQGNLTISALGYARILAMLTNGGEFDGVRVLGEKTVDMMHNADVSAGAYRQGLAVRFRENAFLGEDVYWHTGSSYGELTQCIYSLESGRIAVVLTTGSNSGRNSLNLVDVCTKLSEALWEIGS